MRFNRRIIVSLALTLFACMPTRAPGTIVNPGQTVSLGIGGDDFVPPTGDLLAEKTQDFSVNYELSAGYTPSGPTSFTVTLTSQVVRDPATARLTFLYRIETDGEAQEWLVGSERSTFALNSFAGFTTDIEMIKSSFDLIVTRSADGATIDADTVDVGGSALPWAIIATDATEFDSNGTFSGTLGTELSVIDPDRILTSISPQSDRFTVTGTFQPVTDDNGGGGNVIPLPAGVWLGLVALAGGGAFAKGRRFLRPACH